jgi:hypothetical protein
VASVLVWKGSVYSRQHGSDSTIFQQQLSSEDCHLMKVNFCFSHVLEVEYLKYLYEISKVDCSYILFRTGVQVSHFTVSSDINYKKLTVKFANLSFHCAFISNRSCAANIIRKQVNK